LTFWKENYAEEHPDVAKSYNDIGAVYSDVGEYTLAYEFYLKALDLRLKLFGKNHSDVAKTYLNIGNIFYFLGDYSRQLESYSLATKIFINACGEKHPYVAAGYHNLGIVYQQMGDFESALSHFNKALELRIELLGQNHPEIASSYNNLGVIYEKTGASEKAIECYQNSLLISRTNSGEKNPEVATSYLNIGAVYFKKGDLEEALQYYYKALKIYRQALGENHLHVAECYNNIGVVYVRKGEYDAGNQYYDKSLRIKYRILGQNHPSIAESYSNIGMVYTDIKIYDKALEFHKLALNIYLQNFEENHPEIAICHTNIGVAQHNAGDNIQALQSYHQALGIYLRLPGENHPDLAATYRNIGQVFEDSKDYEKALNYYQQSIMALVTDFNQDSIYVNPNLENIISKTNLFRSLALKARAFEKLFTLESKQLVDIETALSTIELAINLVDQIRHSYKTADSKFFLASQVSQVYDQAIRAAMKLYAATQEEKYKEIAFCFAEKSKSGVLLEAIFESQVKLFTGIPDSLLHYEKRLKADLSFYENSLYTELQTGNSANSFKISLWQEKLFQLKQAQREFIQQLEMDYPEYHKLKYQVKMATVRDIQEQLLDSCSTLVEYFVGDSSIYIFVISQRDFKVVSVKNHPFFKHQIRLMRSGIANKIFPRYSFFAFQLGKILINPIRSFLNSNLIIVPDGILGYLPFEALLCHEAGEKDQNYKKLPYLIRDYAISYGYSATLALEIIHRPFRKPANDFIAFAPVFSPGMRKGFIASSKAMILSSQKEIKRTPEDEYNNLSMLPATEVEIIKIWELFDRNSQKAKVFTHDQANEILLKSADLGNYKYIHFATHGYINELNPALSGIYFARDTSSTEDNVLYSGEIYNLNLKADLVVLSACETALGKFVKGEGIIGLTQGFLYAGASNLVVSLWRVVDQATADLMVLFYQNLLQQAGKAESLRNAKLELIENQQYAAPYYWAPFILIGN